MQLYNAAKYFSGLSATFFSIYIVSF